MFVTDLGCSEEFVHSGTPSAVTQLGNCSGRAGIREAGTHLAFESRDGIPQEINYFGGNFRTTNQAHQWLIPPQHTVGIEPAEGNQVRIIELIAVEKAPKWIKGLRCSDGKFSIERSN